MAGTKLETVAFAKAKQSRSGKAYYSFARVNGDKFTWNDDIVGFPCKDGSIAFKKRVEDAAQDEGLPA